MNVLRTAGEFRAYLEKADTSNGCLADTSFLYALAYDDDRLHNIALEVHDLLAVKKVIIFSNVISRLELVDLIFRKQITNGSIQIFGSMDAASTHKDLFNLVKNIRDNDTAERKQKNSYKIDERRLKNLRREMVQSGGQKRWKGFCKKYVGEMLLNEWMHFEEDLGLNFIEILEGATSDLFEKPLKWEDMVKIMGEHGIRGNDAMIINLFATSKIPLLITGDKDFEADIEDPTNMKTIFKLET